IPTPEKRDNSNNEVVSTFIPTPEQNSSHIVVNTSAKRNMN
ncbi:34380_t:CDS:2, partial [Gigaspora margarita]